MLEVVLLLASCGDRVPTIPKPLSLQFVVGIHPFKENPRAEKRASDSAWLITADEASFSLDKIEWILSEGQLSVPLTNCKIIYFRESREVLSKCTTPPLTEIKPLGMRLYTSQLHVRIKDVIHNFDTDYSYPESGNHALEIIFPEPLHLKDDSPLTLAIDFHHTLKMVKEGSRLVLSPYQKPFYAEVLPSSLWHTELHSSLPTLFNTQGEEFSVRLLFDGTRAKKAVLVGEWSTCRKSSEPLSVFNRAPGKDLLGGYLGQDKNGIISWAVPKENYRWEKYESVMKLFPVGDNRKEDFECSVEEPPLPFDGISYESGAPTTKPQDRRLLYFLGYL